MPGKNKKKSAGGKKIAPLSVPVKPFSAHVNDCATESEYAHAVMQQVACGICRHVGYQTAEASTIHVMTEILERYIETLAEISRSYTELAARTQGNVLDLRAAFYTMGVDIPRLCAYAENNRAGIFETPIPTFPLPAKQHPTTTIPTAAVLKETVAPRPAHIPSYYPPLPPAHTYLATPMYAAPDRDPGEERAQKTREKRQVESALGQFAVKTRVLPSKKIQDDVAVLTMPRPPPYMSAIVGENGLQVKESDVIVDKPSKRIGPGIVVSQPTDDQSDMDLDAEASHMPSPLGSMPGSPSTPRPSPSPVPSPLPT